MKNIIRIILSTFILMTYLPGGLGSVKIENMKESGFHFENGVQKEKRQPLQDPICKNLFNGRNTDGWHEYNSEKPANWAVKDGILYTTGGNGDIVTDKEYENFELEVEWKIKKGGNSGICYYVVEGEQYKSMWETGPEFQIIDENNYPINLLEKQKTGSCSDVLPPTGLASNPPGDWNHTRIVAKNGNIEHWLNGRLILSFSMNSVEWKNAVQESKFSKFDYAKVRKGKIGLQDHGNPVYYRKIRIRKL